MSTTASSKSGVKGGRTEKSLPLQRGEGDGTAAHEKTCKQEERFGNLANFVSALLWVAGPNRLCTFFNNNWLDFTGCTLEQQVGYGWVASVHPHDVDKCLATYSSAYEARRAFRVEYRLRRKDDEYRWILEDGAPRTEAGKGFIDYVGTCTDVTHLRTTQPEDFGTLRDESLHVLAGGIAHDLTNLMSTILATAEAAEMEAKGSLPASETINTIKQVAGRAVEMARELMIYEGRDKGSVELVNLSKLVAEMAEILKAAISKRSVLNMALQNNVPQIWANPTHIRQIVMNLTINASDAIGEAGGSIGIHISQVTAEQRTCATRTNRPLKNYVKLEVSDTGCGVANDQRSRIFEPFFTTKSAGSGLGLAVVRRIVQSHNGIINVHSIPDRGTNFEILFPVS